MLIILEGLDKSGKTTFAQRFGSDAIYYHSDAETDTMKMFRQAYKASLREDKPVILDRSFMSEIAYGTAYRNDVKLTQEEYEIIVERLIAIPHIILYFKRPISKCKFEDNEFESDTSKLSYTAYIYSQLISDLKDKLNIYEVKYYD